MDLSDLPSLSTVTNLIVRAVYTAVLAVAAFLLLREAFRLWVAEPLTLGELTFVDAGTVKPEAGAGLVRDIIDRRNALRDVILRLVKEQEQTVKSTEPLAANANPIGPVIEIAPPYRAFSNFELNDLKDAADSAPRIELKIQGNDIGSLLTSLQRWISPMNALKVSVFKREDQFSFLLDWPNDDLSFAETHADSAFRADVFEEGKLGAAIGCRIIWLELAESASRIAETHPDVFCRWAEARMLYEAAIGAVSAGAPAAVATGRFEKAIAILGDLPVTERQFTPVQYLYALLLGEMGRPGPEVDHAWSNFRRVTSGEPALRYEAPTQLAAAPGVDTQTGAGQLVAFRMTGGAFSRVTVAAVVRDADNNRFLVVPDYAFELADTSQGPAEVWASDSLGGPVGVRIGTFDRVHKPAGVALIALEPGVTAGNEVLGRSLAAIGPAGVGDEVTLLSATRPEGQPAKIAAVIDDQGPPRLVTDSKVTQPGDGGAPVVNTNDALIAMGYSGSANASELVALLPALEQLELTLAN